MAESEAKYTMNDRETWWYLAEYFHGKTDALKEGVCHVILDLWRSEKIDSKTMTDIRQVISELPELRPKYGWLGWGYCWPLTTEGHAQRSAFCMSKATEGANNG